MKTDQYNDPAGVFPQSLTDTVSKLKNRLQRQYEQIYPELGDLVRIVLDEEEARAWELSFPHLFLPDLVEAHITRLGCDRQRPDKIACESRSAFRQTKTISSFRLMQID